MTFSPLGDRVLIDPLEDPSVVGSIHVPEIAREKAHLGKVLAVGPGQKLENGTRGPMTVKVGDKVIMTAYRYSQAFQMDGRDVYVLSERDVLAVL